MVSYDQTPADRAESDQAHAALRDLAAHLREHAHLALGDGTPPYDVAVQMAQALQTSAYTRSTLACLLGVALTDLDLAQHKRNGGPS